jgi:hypothetical protein
MVAGIDRLLRTPGFWWTLVVINLIFLEAQPSFAILCGAGVLLLYLVCQLGKLLQRIGMGRVFRVCALVCCFFLTAGVLATFLAAVGVADRDAQMLTALLANAALWVGIPVAYRSRRKKRERAEYAAAMRRAERDAEERARAQKRREQARAGCEALYALYAPEIKDRFPRADFDAFLKKYLGDQHAPEFVEERAEQLRQIIEQHRQRIEPPKKKMSLAELAEWFLREKRQIDATPLDDEDKEALVAQLEARYAKLQEKHIRSMEP